MRERFVYPTRLIPHLWAHQTQGQARNPQGNLYFTGPVIYSYRDSFPIGRLLKRKGQKVALLTSSSYSVTTSSHQRDASYAVSHLSTFTVPDIGSEVWDSGYSKKTVKVDHKRNLKFFKNRIADCAKKEIRARIYSIYHHRDALRLIAEGNNYAGFFGLKTRFTYPEDAALKRSIQAERKVNAKENAYYREQLKARAIKRAKEYAEKLQAWLIGDHVYLPYGISTRVHLRVRGDRVETSRGASVPIGHARRVIALVRLIKLGQREPYEHNGHSVRVGDFTVDSITSEGTLHAGCHAIRFEELEAVAVKIGLSPFTV